MKKKLNEMRYGERYFLFPISPIRTFVSLDFNEDDGMWWLSYTENGGGVMRKPLSKGEMEEEWNVINNTQQKDTTYE